MSLNNKIFINRCIKKHNHKYNYSLVKYKTLADKVTIICRKHGKFEQVAEYHMNGSGCQLCNKRGKNSGKEIIERFKKTHLDDYDYSLVDYKTTRTKVLIICKKHGKFLQTPMSHMNGSGCPICKNSKGEIKIRNYLLNTGLTFYQEYKFKNCFDKLKLPFDFYLPELNTVIEYDGVQHFQEIKQFGGFKRFKETKKRDEIKNKFCKENKINLIRIPFYYFSQIEEILKFKLRN